MKTPSFTIKGVKAVQAGEATMIQLDYSYDEKIEQRFVTHTGWLKVDPAKYWCILAGEDQNNDQGFRATTHYHFDVSPDPRGLPILKRYAWKMTGTDREGKQHAREGTNDFELNFDDTVPDREFTLSAFGLPEPVGVTWDSGPRYYLWFIGITAGCFLVALVAGYLARRKKPVAKDAATTPKG